MNDECHTPEPTGKWVYTDDIVKKYCVGKGIEVGPSDNPVRGVDTVLVDNKTDFAGKKYTVDYVMEADNLYLFRDDQFDFLIASHMLEHFPNPIRALKEWYRVVRDGGILFIVVPQKGRTFDKYRSTTKLSHMIEDYEKNIDNPDPTHIDEWCNYSVPVIEAEQGDSAVLAGHSTELNSESAQDIQVKQEDPVWERVERFRSILKQQVKDGIKIDIHFHTWERTEDMIQLMDYLGWEVVEAMDHYAIGRPLGEGNGILTVVRVRKSRAPVKTRVLFLTDEKISSQMRGAGIRFYEMANRLSEVCEVTLVTIEGSDLKPEKFKVAYCERDDEDTLQKYLDTCDILILQGQVLKIFPSLGFSEKISVIDLSVPATLQNLEQQRKEGGNLGTKLQIHQEVLSLMNHSLRVGDYFICSHPVQRNLWLGMLCSQNRINPHTYQEDPSGRNLIDVVPYGIPEESPIHSRQVLKGVYPGIKSRDKVLLWGSCVTERLDPLTVIKAMVLVKRQRDDIKLFFMGTKHPNEIHERIWMDSIDAAKILSLYDTVVFFNTEVSYENRQNYLLEADIGVSIYPIGLDAQFSSGSQILDYIWAGLPILTTKGTPIGDLVDQYQLGLSVEPCDEEGLATAILKLVDDEPFRQRCVQNVRTISSQFTWKTAVRPLLEFCKNPRRSATQKYGEGESSILHTPTFPFPRSLRRPFSQLPFRLVSRGSSHRIVGLFANLKTSLRRRRLKLSNYPSCLIWGTHQVGQSFVAEYPNLYRIDIKFATYFKQIQNLTFHLKKGGEEGEEIASIPLSVSEVWDNVFYQFVFPQQTDSQGKLYYFYLESPDSDRENAVSVWCTEKYSPAQFGCQPIACYERGWKSRGQVMFRTYYI